MAVCLPDLSLDRLSETTLDDLSAMSFICETISGITERVEGMRRTVAIRGHQFTQRLASLNRTLASDGYPLTEAFEGMEQS